IPLRGDQRRKSAEEFVVAALVDAPRYCHAKKFQSLLARLARISFSRQRQGPRISSPLRKRNHSRGGKSFPLRAIGRARSRSLRRNGSNRSLQPKSVSGDQEIGLHPDPRSPFPLLVYPRAAERKKTIRQKTGCPGSERLSGAAIIA